MTATVALSPPPILQFFNNAGRPNAGGSVLTQVGGVNYPTYQDSAGAVPLPNPIPLNSRGEISTSVGASAQLFLVGGVIYTFTVYDKDGNQINQPISMTPGISYSQLSVPNGASLVGADDGSSGSIFTTVQGFITKILSSAGSSIVGFIQAGTGAVTRTLQDKSRENVSGQDFGAIGNGVTNDSAAFTLLETSYFNHDIDLDGLTYFVNAIPAKNRYNDGYFNISKTTTINGSSYPYTYKQSAMGISPTAPSVSLIRDARSSTSIIAYTLTQVLGMQAHAIDEVGGNIYTLHVSGSPEVSFVSQYPMSVGTSVTATGVSNSSAQLGHQGLSPEKQTTAVEKLWGPVRYDATNFPLGHTQAIRFEYAGNAANLANIQSYTLFDSSFSYTANATLPTVSYDQRFLCAVGRKDSRTFFVHVFDLATLVAGGAGDYSTKWLYEWQIDSDILADDASGAFCPVQTIACDGELVYVGAGNSSLNGKHIHAYTIDGVRVQVENNVSVGLTEATADGTFYEPECMAVYRPDSGHPCLSWLVVSGAGGAHKNRIFAMGYSPPAGTWTPTIVNGTNAAASTAYVDNYIKSGNILVMGGRIAAQAVAIGSVELNVSLPPGITSNFSSLVQAGGTIFTQTAGNTAGGSILADTTNKNLLFRINAISTTNTAYSWTAVCLITA